MMQCLRGSASIKLAAAGACAALLASWLRSRRLRSANTSVLRIVLTGGPCAGKSSALSHLTAALNAHGVDVLCVPEVPTILINGGAAYPGVDGGARLIAFEIALIEAQAQLEKSFISIAEASGRPTAVVMDRGLLDVAAYLPSKVLAQTGWSTASLAARYDMVLHLASAACGAEAYYSTENNSARTETVEQARELDAKVFECWSRHPKVHRVDNSSDFAGKIERATQLVVDASNEVFGEPEGTEC